MGLTDTASIRTRTCPRAGSGLGSSPISIQEAGPVARINAAFIDLTAVVLGGCISGSRHDTHIQLVQARWEKLSHNADRRGRWFITQLAVELSAGLGGDLCGLRVHRYPINCLSSAWPAKAGTPTHGRLKP